MRKKLIKRYVLLSVPFICGSILYGMGLYGIVSSILFFGGGYIVVKNIFDYRMVNKNKKICMLNDKNVCNDNNSNDDILLLDSNNIDYNDVLNNDNKKKYRYKYKNSDDISWLKSTRLYIKVRRRY